MTPWPQLESRMQSVEKPSGDSHALPSSVELMCLLFLGIPKMHAASDRVRLASARLSDTVFLLVDYASFVEEQDCSLCIPQQPRIINLLPCTGSSKRRWSSEPGERCPRAGIQLAA